MAAIDLAFSWAVDGAAVRSCGSLAPSVVQSVVPLLQSVDVQERWFVTRFVEIVAPGDGLQTLPIGDPP